MFVSHSAETVRAICPRVLWLDNGRLVSDGPAEAVVARYLAHSWKAEETGVPLRFPLHGKGRPEARDDRRWGSGEVRIVGVRLLDGRGQEKRLFQVGEPLAIEIRYRAEKRVQRPVFGLAIHRSDGTHVTGPNTRLAGLDIPAIEGEGQILYRVHRLPLMEGRYLLSVSAHDEADVVMYDYHDRLYPVQVVQRGEGERYGLVSLGGEWVWDGGRRA